jgi:hypothetical protein
LKEHINYGRQWSWIHPPNEKTKPTIPAAHDEFSLGFPGGAVPILLTGL